MLTTPQNKKPASSVVCVALTSSPQAFALPRGLLRDTLSAGSATGPGVPLYVVRKLVTYVYMYLRWVPSGEKAAGSAALGEPQLSGWKQAATLGVPRKGVRASPVS